MFGKKRKQPAQIDLEAMAADAIAAGSGCAAVVSQSEERSEAPEVTYMVEKPGLVKRVTSALLTIEVAILLVAAIVSVGLTPLGVTPFGVLTGSMEPAIQTGALAFVNTKVAPEDMRVGDIVAFHSTDDAVVTHRIHEIDEEAGAFITKGDANAQVDARPVPFEDVIGQTVYSIPEIGNALYEASNYKIPLLLVVTGITVALGLLNAFAPSRYVAKAKRG